jgi:preprotein translocase subunit SecG
LIVRTRYSVVNRVEDDMEPAILLYQLRTNILARFALIMVVLLESSKLYGLLSHFKTFLKNVLFAIMVIGFYSPITAILASTLAIYLTIAKVYNAGKYGVFSALLFGLCSFLFMAGRVSFNIPAIMVTIYSIFILLR